MIKRISKQSSSRDFDSSKQLGVAVWASKQSGGFTLVELLTVITIAGLLAVLSVPAVQGLQKAGGFNKSVYAMSDSLNLARSYAIANNTYVYIGLTEVDRTQSSGANPQVVGSGLGRVALSMVATKDGTSDIASWSSTGSNLTQIRQVQTYDFFHITSSVFPTTTTGAMARPTNVTTTSEVIPAAATPAVPFSLPLGSTSGSGKYNFTNTNSQVICVNPQGQVLLPVLSSGVVVLQPVQWLEIDLQPVVGSATPAIPTNVNQGDQAALIIDGLTGAVTVYRP